MRLLKFQRDEVPGLSKLALLEWRKKAIEMKWLSLQQAQCVNSIWTPLPFPRDRLEESDEEQQLFITPSMACKGRSQQVREESLMLQTHVIPGQEGKESLAIKELFKVLKDHSNHFMQELVSASYQHCFVSEVENVLKDPTSSTQRNAAQKMLFTYVLSMLRLNPFCLRLWRQGNKAKRECCA
ncbi:hypothetical protein OS493_006882 [Desmophyllum pertusum]|uniref:Uncharacterized protein n=1 Tax=Desmophyllum pertusum TaxID=174260 RepID=A0A9X0D4S1_9CNID|nr:hypothetical protein OS493_006882 [Desmophyllum pertusum]